MKPKVLFISNNCFSDSANNGKTFKSIFSDYRDTEIAQIYFTEITPPDFTFCKRYFFISDKDVFKNIFHFHRGTGKLGLPEHFDNPLRNDKPYQSKMFSRSLVRLVRDFIWSFGSWKSSNLIEFMTSFNPDVIFFVGGPCSFSHNIALFAKKILKKPLVIYFTDDYLLYPVSNNIWDIIQKGRMLSFFKSTIGQAELCLTIGEKMSRTYGLFFQSCFETIMNSVPLLEFPDETPQTGKLIISYFGSLHTNRGDMIERLGSIIKKYFSDSLELNIFTTQNIDPEIQQRFTFYNIILKEPVFGADLTERMQNSNFLLHVESDLPTAASTTKLSVSTKIPEYLMSGKPLIGFGPSNVASMELIKDNGIGFFIDSSFKDEVIVQNLTLILNNDTSKTISCVGHKFAIKNFDNKKNIQRIQYLLKTKL